MIPSYITKHMTFMDSYFLFMVSICGHAFKYNIKGILAIVLALSHYNSTAAFGGHLIFMATVWYNVHKMLNKLHHFFGSPTFTGQVILFSLEVRGVCVGGGG